MRRLSAVLLALGVAALGGCGGGPSKNSFLAEADDTCRSANAPVASAKAPTSFPELAEGAKGVAAATDAQVPELRALDRPGGDKERTDAVFAALGGVATTARSLQAAAEKKDDRASAQAANDLSARSREAGDGARAYGFTACGVGTQRAATPLTDATKTIIKAGFVAKAEGICRETSRKLEGIPEPTSRTSASRAFNTLLPLADKMITDLRALVVPPGDEATLTDLFDAEQKVLEKLREYLAVLKADDSRKASVVEDELEVAGTAADAKADAYGVKACGTDF